MPAMIKKYGGLGPHIMQARIDEITKAIRPERLLIFRLQERWEPLCKVCTCRLLRRLRKYSFISYVTAVFGSSRTRRSFPQNERCRVLGCVHQRSTLKVRVSFPNYAIMCDLAFGRVAIIRGCFDGFLFSPVLLLQE